MSKKDGIVSFVKNNRMLDGMSSLSSRVVLPKRMAFSYVWEYLISENGNRFGGWETYILRSHGRKGFFPVAFYSFRCLARCGLDASFPGSFFSFPTVIFRHLAQVDASVTHFLTGSHYFSLQSTPPFKKNRK